MVAEDAECLTLDPQGIIRALGNANCPGCALNGCIRSRGELKKLPAPAQPKMVQESKATHDSDDGFEVRADSTNTLIRLETRVDPFDDNDWQQDPRPRFLKEKKHGGTADHETIPDGFAAEEIPDVEIKWKLLEDSPHKKQSDSWQMQVHIEYI